MTLAAPTSPRTETLVNCPVCESNHSKHFFSAPDRLHGVLGEFSYSICGSCNSVFQNPMVIGEDLHLCYPAEYSPYSLTREVPDLDFDALPANDPKQKLRRAVVESLKGRSPAGFVGFIGRLLARSRFVRERAFYGLVIDECLPRGEGPHHALDLGCGSGWFMQKLHKVGWDVEGLEWNQEAALKAHEITGFNVFAGDFRSVDIPEGKYDLIVLNHVIEHLSDPGPALQRLHVLLNDGGKVVMFYPNPHSVGSNYFHEYWYAWDPPRHLIFPTADGLAPLGVKAGFRRQRVWTRAFYPTVQWKFSKNYRMGRDSEDSTVQLSLREIVGIWLEKILARVGVNKGWEIIAVLEK